ncbi:glycosyltransferase [Flavobacterium sp. CS20]|uniref:glycosyltransferase n=1 Tax=Flavobacterium sp. CS20 TaxID=2775246 RepID=UPI001FFD1F3A|nr:glycosyltransferase [Flavobacterium sp. CS20]
MKKIKVLHISETFVTGVYTYIQSICAFTAQNSNIETHIIYSPNREGTDQLNFKKDFSPDTKLVVLPMQREVSFLKDYKSLQHLKKAIKQIKPDVIHLHSSKAGVLGRIARKS